LCVDIDCSSEEDLVPVPLVSSAVKGIARFRMRGFVSDEGREVQRLLVGMHLCCEPLRLGTLAPRIEQLRLCPGYALKPPYNQAGRAGTR